MDDADKAERLLRNLAQRLERDWSGVAGSILEGIDEILTITRLGLPKELRRSLACTDEMDKRFFVTSQIRGDLLQVCSLVRARRRRSYVLSSRPPISQPPRTGAVKAGRVLSGHRKAWP